MIAVYFCLVGFGVAMALASPPCHEEEEVARIVGRAAGLILVIVGMWGLR